jgi:hypothetical protein
MYLEVQEAAMPLLQVRDFPDDIYAEISYIACKQNRTIAQEVVTLLKKGLEEETTNRERRRLTFERIKPEKYRLKPKKSTVPPSSARCGRSGPPRSSKVAVSYLRKGNDGNN